MELTPTVRTATTPTTATPTEPTAPIPTGPTRPSDDPFRSLAELVGREAVPAFLDRVLGKGAYRARIPPETTRAWFGWPQLNAALAEHRLAPPRLRLEQAGADVTKGVFKERRSRRGASLSDLDAVALTAKLRDGATLILDAANELSPPLQRLCAGLSAAFAASCQANLYACWGETQGFDVHWDDHDVFVVQVEGRKRWDLYGATRPAPTRRDFQAEHPRPETPIEQTVLGPGEVLYLPRGYWHAAVGLGEPSLHLTVGLTRKTGADFLHWLADQSLSEAEARADLPLERDDARLGEHLAGLLAGVASRDPAELARLYRRHVEATQPQRPALSFPYIGAEIEFAPGDRIALAAGAARLRRGEEAGTVILSWRGVDYTLAAALEPPFRALIAGRALAYADFAAAVPAPERDKVAAFLAEMSRRGVLVVDGAGR